MKSKKQIEHFLARKKYRSEIDFEGIKLYCKNKFGIKLHHPSSFSEDKTSLDYNIFANWLENGYGAGDIVKWDDCIGLIQEGGIEEVKICLRIDGNGPNFDSFMIPVEVITLAEENASERIYSVLEETGQEFGNPFFAITPKYIPSPCSIVTFNNRHTKEEGYGVVRIIKETGEVIMYCYVIKGQEVKYSMNEFLGMKDDFTFQSSSAADYPRRALEVALAKVGKTWNHFLKRIEPMNMKVVKGDRYWYITDKMQVTSDVEKETPVSNKRYLAGNYFRRQEDAIRILEAEMEIRRNFLAEPER